MPDVEQEMPWLESIPARDREVVAATFGEFVRPISAGTRPALIVIDMTEAFVSDRYPTGWSAGGVPATAAIAGLLAAARAATVPVFFTKSRPEADGERAKIEKGLWHRPRSGPAKDAPSGNGDSIVEALAPLADEPIIYKFGKPSAFFATPLASLLTLLRVDTVILTGMSTSGCVRATAIDAFELNYHVLIPHECVADRSQISHDVALFDLHAKHADVVSGSRVLEYLGQLRQPA